MVLSFNNVNGFKAFRTARRNEGGVDTVAGRSARLDRVKRSKAMVSPLLKQYYNVPGGGDDALRQVNDPEHAAVARLHGALKHTSDFSSVVFPFHHRELNILFLLLSPMEVDEHGLH